MKWYTHNIHSSYISQSIVILLIKLKNDTVKYPFNLLPMPAWSSLRILQPILSAFRPSVPAFPLASVCILKKIILNRILKTIITSGFLNPLTFLDYHENRDLFFKLVFLSFYLNLYFESFSDLWSYRIRPYTTSILHTITLTTLETIQYPQCQYGPIIRFILLHYTAPPSPTVSALPLFEPHHTTAGLLCCPLVDELAERNKWD